MGYAQAVCEEDGLRESTSDGVRRMGCNTAVLAGTRFWTEAEVIKRDLEDQLSRRAAPAAMETVTQVTAAVDRANWARKD